MSTIAAESAMSTFEIIKEIKIAAPPEIVFESILAQLGPDCEMLGGEPFPMRLEAWPGGRWYRDLGNQTGHNWGHVQVIKPPTLLEICGPLFMSYAAVSHLQYRLTAEGKETRLKFVHTALGLITPDHRDGVGEGWGYWLTKIREISERRA
jgi:uncharacterized protein YndB with AHSA1/START domain